MRAKFHPNRTNFSVKLVARRKVTGPKSTNFTRCSTYSASNDNFWGQMEFRKLELCLYLINYFHYACAKNYPKPTILRSKRLARQKQGETKKHNFHKTLDLLWFRWQSLESRGAEENETLHVVSQIFPLCALQISSEWNKFQRKWANEEKSGRAKKHKFHEMLDLFCFQS